MLNRIGLIAVAIALLLSVFAPVALAADGVTARQSLLVSVNGSVDVAADQHVDTLIVVSGTTHVGGDVSTLIVVAGTATLSDATVRDVYLVDGRADLQAGTVVSGSVRTLRGTVSREGDAVIQGGTASFDGDLVALGVLLAGLLVALFLGFALAVLVFALLLAGLAGRQVRTVESIITREPGRALVTGLVAGIGVPLAAVLLFVTVIGAPVGIALLVLSSPLSFIAWIVAAMWLGDWLVTRLRGVPEPERPYRAAVVGVIVLAIAGLVPLVSAIATFFGLGALVLAGWRGLGHTPAAAQPMAPSPVPSPS